MKKEILKVEKLTKLYPGVIALNNASFSIEEGEVHALVGENGAGKSTLIKAITGAITPDEGTIEFDGETYGAMTPAISRAAGIEAIYQEFNLAASLSVAENIFVGQKLTKGPLISFKKLYSETKKVMSDFNVNINPKQKVSELSVAKMQLVEITKAVAKNAKLLIMDEPTAPLTEDEVEVLFSIVRKLKQNGVTIIYISHRLDELFQITDRVTVMRDGQIVSTHETKNLTKDKLIFDMVGRELKEQFPKRIAEHKEVVLEVKNIYGNGIKDISFELRKGEVLGFAGLVGAGRTELMRLIFGADKLEKGKIFIEGKEVKIKMPQDAVASGLGLITEDRKTQGVILSKSIKWNTTITILKELSKGLVINKKKEKEKVLGLKESLKIKTPTIEQLVGNLSGGNQQKVAIAKWLASSSKVLVFDEPTRGIDVGAKYEIYQLINNLAAEGVGIIIVSSDMEEILGMSDSLIVLAEGRLAGKIEKQDFKQETVLKMASGE